MKPDASAPERPAPPRRDTTARQAALLAAFQRGEAANAALLVEWLRPLLGDAALADRPAPPRERLCAALRDAYETQGLFDPEFYRATYLSGTPLEDVEPIADFITRGRALGFDPNGCLDMLGYLDRYPDILRAGLDPCLHFAEFGWHEGRDPGPGFEPAFYLGQAAGGQAAGAAGAEINPLRHYLSEGRHRGLMPTRAAARAAAEAAIAQSARVPPEEQVAPAAAAARGTIVLVCHDAEGGEALDTLLSQARWLHERTRFEVRLVTLAGGRRLPRLEQLAPTLALDSPDPRDPAARLAAFAGPDLRAVVLTSLASAAILPHWGPAIPVLSLVHEAPAQIEAEAGALALIAERATTVIAGSPAVAAALRDSAGIGADRLAVVGDLAGTGGSAGTGKRGDTGASAGASAEAGPWLLAHIRAAAGLAPEVSVVVPNYNYESYLPQRLESIARQSFQDFEVILLDDASPDGSLQVLQDWARDRPAVRVIANERNSGSPFAQWIKGMELAQSELIWIAEADDYCEPDLLATLLPCFRRRNVFLGYVKSVPVDAGGKVLGDYEDLYLNRINRGRWATSYTVTDHEEASAGLGIANCIPNASSVILRKFRVEDSFRQLVTGMKLCGDWLFYLRAMRGGMVTYAARPLNYHRRHGTTVTARTEGSLRYFDEFRDTRAYVARTYRLSPEARDKIAAFTRQDLDRFGVDDPARRDGILATLSAIEEEKPLPSVLFAAPDLTPGGGQMFIIRLANAWAARGGRAVLLNIGQFPTHAKVFSRLSGRVAAFTIQGAGGDLLKRLCTRFDIDLIHSSIWWADKYIRQHIDDLPGTGWVISMHGCHETILQHPDVDRAFPDDMAFMRQRVDEWVHTADKNMAVFTALGAPPRHRRIRNGVELDVTRPLSRAELGLREEAVVLCLASRAIESKGWFQAVEVTQQLNARNVAVDLMLIGEGPAADAVAADAPAHVHLYGHVDNLHDYISAADIGILPSFFVGESMPLILLEMMALGKPVVTTDVGEIPRMVGTGDTAGGLLVPLRDGHLDTAAFAAAVLSLATSPERRQTCGRAAQRRFEAEYTMDAMVTRYTEVYEEALAARQAAE